MKPVFRLLIVLFGAGIILLGLSKVGGWFTDFVENPLSLAVSGSLNIEVSADSLSALDVIPGEDYSDAGMFCVKNAGTVDLKYRGRFESDLSGQYDFIQYMVMKVEQLSGGLWETLLEVSGSGEAGDESLAAYFKFSDQAPEVINRYIVQEDLSPGEVNCFRMSVRLEPDTPDAFQNRSLEFYLHLYATQPENPGWDE